MTTQIFSPIQHLPLKKSWDLSRIIRTDWLDWTMLLHFKAMYFSIPTMEIWQRPFKVTGDLRTSRRLLTLTSTDILTHLFYIALNMPSSIVIMLSHYPFFSAWSFWFLVMQDELCKTRRQPWWRRNHLEEIQFESEEASQRPSRSTISTGAWRISKAGGKFLCKPPSRMYMWNNNEKVETEPIKFCTTSSQGIVPSLRTHILVEWQSRGAMRRTSGCWIQSPQEEWNSDIINGDYRIFNKLEGW